MAFDLFITEANGNGGDILLKGNDLAVVFGIENMPYLGMFGGNLKPDKITNARELSYLYWANDLFYLSEKSVQFNSITETIFNTTELTSEGRIIIEEAIKTDLKFLSDMGYKVVVSVTIPATDKIIIKITLTQPDGDGVITTLEFKKQPNGDFFLLDFNNDFFVG